MRSAQLDRRVRREAVALVREARAALSLKRGLRGKAGDLESATAAVEQGLAAKDLRRVRAGLPVLDALVDELIKRPPKSTTRDYVESIAAAVMIALALRAFVIEAFKIPSSSMYPTLEIGDHIFVNKFIYGVRIPYTSTKFFELRAPKRGEVIVFMQPCQVERDYIKRVIALAGDTVEVRCNVVYVNGQPIEHHLIEPDCSYKDYVENLDGSGSSWADKRCSLYSETVAGHEYFTYHDPGRPQRDKTLHDTGALPEGDAKDFPQAILYSCSNASDPDSKKAENQKPGRIVDVKAEGTNACEPHRHYVVPEGHVFVMGDNRANSNDSRYWGSVPIENIKGKALFIWLSYRDFALSWPPNLQFRWDRIGNFVK